MILTIEERKELQAGHYNSPAQFFDAVEAAVIANLCTVDMPEPVGYLDGQGDSYTADQLRTAVAAARVKALEDAAVVCAEVVTYPPGHGGQYEGYGPVKTTRSGNECADAIRALKGTTP